LLQIAAPTKATSTDPQEATLTLQRQIGATSDVEFVDLFQNYYPGGTYPEVGDGIRIQKRNNGNLQPFSISYSTGLGTVSNVMWIQPVSQSSSLGGSVAFGLSTSTAKAMVNINGTLYVQATSTINSTLYLGDTNPGCIAMKDESGGGTTYITSLNGALNSTTTKPAVCQ
jgi:hypothetical protein